MSTQKKIILSKPEDWDTWISFVRIKAEIHEVWNLIDPDLPSKPKGLTKPIQPTFDLGDASTFDLKAFKFYKDKQVVYKSDFALYNEQKTAFTSVISLIQETITAENAILIQKTESHPYDLLVALKQRLAPTDQARSLQLEKRYERLKKGPGGGQNIETWVNEWYQMYIDASLHQLAEVSWDRPIRDFLLAIHSKDPAYSTSQQNFQDLNPRTMDQIIENYRQHLRLHSAAKKTRDHSAFAANQGSTKKSNQPGSQGSNSTFRGNQIPTPKCICGKTHWYPDCFHLNPKKQRPNGWTELSETRQKVDEALKNPAIKDKVQTSLAKRLAAEQRQAEQSPQADKPDTNASILFDIFILYLLAMIYLAYSLLCLYSALL